MQLGEFRDEIPFKLGMMWHQRKIHSHLDMSLHSLHYSKTAYQISGRNFFQVGDDVTTRTFKVSITRF
ncbi:hypothetical protein Hanom_Chr10g00917081 [Helianthus anomalus]